jgi:hypothetical protein
VAPQTGTALLVIGAFVLPGFVTLLLRERTYWVRVEASPFERLLNALYYSSIIYFTAGVFALAVGLDTADVRRIYQGKAELGWYVLVALAGLFALPMAIAEIGRRWQISRRVRPWFLEKSKIDPGHSVPSGWEQLYANSPGSSEGRGLLLRVTLEDGRVVGGFFGQDSLAGYTSQTRDLFIEERWSFDDDGWFQEPAQSSRGLWISEKQIQSVEAYSPPVESV